MTDKKILVIQENKSAVLAALNSYMDYIYNLHDTFFEDNGDLKEGLSHDNQIEELITSSKDRLTVFENIREKITANDFNLSLVEINYIGLAFLFTSLSFKKQLENLQRAIELSDSIYNSLTEGKIHKI